MTFDLLVLGGGSGGIASAIRAAKYGAKVGVIEQHHLGGTCVNLGCVPKKLMYNASLIASMIDKAPSYGFNPCSPLLDWYKLVSNREQYIKQLHRIYEKRFAEFGITKISGHGTFINPNTLGVEKKRYQANHIIIATGGKPLQPQSIEGIEHSIDSDGFFSLKSQPKHVAIVGGGYIGVELAGVLHGLGSKTHLLIRGPRPLRRFDSMLGNTLLQIMQKEQLHVHPNQSIKSIQIQKNGKKTLHGDEGFLLQDLDAVIVAVGRSPCTSDLGLESLGVDTNKQGLIVVDPYQNTSVKGIYAIGDVTTAPALTPVAIAAGRRLCDRLFGGQKEARLKHDSVCSVVFSHPPVASVGLSEEQALEKYGEEAIKVYQTTFNPLFDALSEKKTPTAMKLVTKGPEETIIGIHIIGYFADEMLQGFGVALNLGVRKQDFDNTIAIHPTSSEELVTMT